MQYSHKCQKCGASYQDNDPEPYFCAVCNDERKRLAKEVDAKMAGHVSKRTYSPLKAYDDILKKRGFVKLGEI